MMRREDEQVGELKKMVHSRLELCADLKVSAAAAYVFCVIGAVL